jgi:plastocyanin domain-containing protein
MRHLPLAVVAVVLVSFSSLGACAKKSAPEAEPVASSGGPIAITADDTGFHPSAVKLAKGAAASLVFTRTTDDTCATEVVFPQLDVKKELPKGTPVTIAVPTDKEQTLTFQCGMGMYKSSVVVSAR